MSRRRTRPIRIPNVTLDSRRSWWIRAIADCSPSNGSSGSSAYCIWWRGVMAARHLAVNERRRLRVSDSGAIRSRLVPALGLDDRIEHATWAGLSLPRNMIAPWWQRDTKPEPGRRPRREIPAACCERSWSCGPLRANDVGHRPGEFVPENALTVGTLEWLRPILRIDHAARARTAE